MDHESAFAFLDALRASGKTNMFGGAVYLQDEYGCSRTEARDMLRDWMESFSRDTTPAERAATFAPVGAGE